MLQCNICEIIKNNKVYWIFILMSIAITLKSIYFPVEREEWIVTRDEQNQVISVGPPLREEKKSYEDTFLLNLEDLNHSTFELNLSFTNVNSN